MTDRPNNLAKMVEDAAGGAEIEACVIGTHYMEAWGDDEELYNETVVEWIEDCTYPAAPFIPWAKRGIVLAWSEAKPLLDYPYTDYNCHSFMAWTADRVIYTDIPEGPCDQFVYWTHRNPTPHRPGSYDAD